MDKRAPKFVPFDRIDPRGRLIENEHGRVVQNGHGELEPLFYAKRQALWTLIGNILQVILLKQFLDPALNLIRGQMIEMRVQVEILPDSEFLIKRERLRHVPDIHARLHVVGFHGLAKQLRRPLCWRQKSCQHFHCRGLAATVRAQEAEDLAAIDAEAHMVHRCEIAEPLSKAVGLDDRWPGVVGGPRPHDDWFVFCTLLFRQQVNEGRL